jgi:hypothetical protein
MDSSYFPRELMGFVMLYFLSKMVDKAVLFLQFILKYIPFLKDSFEPAIAYGLVTGMSYVACWRLNFSIFAVFGWPTVIPHEGWIGTALVLSGGSKFMREISDHLDYMPGFLSSIVNATRRVIIGNTPGKDTNTNVIVAAATNPGAEGASSAAAPAAPEGAEAQKIEWRRSL